MNEKIINALKSKDTLIRRHAIVALEQIVSEESIKVLAQVYRTDPDPNLRELSKGVARNIRQRLKEQEAHLAELEEAMPSSVAPKKLEGAEKQRIKKAEEESSASFNLWVFGGVAVILGILVIFLLLGETAGRLIDQQTALAQINSAEPFPVGQVAYGATLEGKLYRGTLSSGSFFVVQEPRGIPPTNGWTLLVGVYNGDAENALGGLRRVASDENWLLLVPQFSRSPENMLDFGMMAGELQEALAQVKTVYPTNLNTETLYGVGIGANFASQFVTWYPDLFGIASLGNGNQYVLPNLNARARYVVFAGQGENVSATVDFIARLTSINKKPYQSGVIQGGGIELKEQLNATVALVKELE